jgi:endonuclease/exonuclease/phosphatase (EEP) superfamily protein YafD
MAGLRFFLGGLAAGILLVGAALAAAGGIMTQGGRLSLTLDIAAHFAPVWVAGGLVAATCALALPRDGMRRAIILLSLVAVLSAGQPILSEVLRKTSPRAAGDAPRQIKLIQFNAWHRNRDLDGAARWIAAQRPDVVVVEETSPQLLAAMQRHGRWNVSCRKCSVMVFSPHELTRVRVVREKGRQLPAVSLVTLPAPGGGRYTVAGVHFTWPTEVGGHQDQVAGLNRLLARQSRERTILAGDFNSTPWSASRRAQDRALGLERRTKALFSWPIQTPQERTPVPMPFLPIDHIYAGSAWRTVSVTRGPKLGSDHYPVVAVFALEG